MVDLHEMESQGEMWCFLLDGDVRCVTMCTLSCMEGTCRRGVLRVSDVDFDAEAWGKGRMMFFLNERYREVQATGWRLSTRRGFSHVCFVSPGL